MAVSLSEDLHWTSLVFERVAVGTLHNLLHNRVTKTHTGWFLFWLYDMNERYTKWENLTVLEFLTLLTPSSSSPTAALRVPSAAGQVAAVSGVAGL